MDRLGDQDAAAIAGERAAARLVIVALRPPPGHVELHGGDASKGTFGQKSAQGFRALTEAVLEDDTGGDTGALGRSNDRLGPSQASLERLLHQDVLARSGDPLDQLEPRIGRGQQHDRVDVRRVQHRLEAVGDGQAEARVEGSAAVGRRAPGEHIDAVGELDQALGVRCHRHAEPDEADLSFGHWRFPDLSAPS